jgi:Trypsin-co-occurring domain 1
VAQRTVTSIRIDPNTSVLVEIDPSAPSGVADDAEGIPKDVIRMINEVGAAAKVAAERLQPDALSMEFGLEVGGEAGVPFVTKGTATANFTVSVEWTKS